ncbi:unnamed protein product [Arabis nemorensis]|uniref:Uncharacterized protein n=1 Tax=Arabis nemorensis TaxID=586526 RepID=A0A565BYI2_9BRAS|nr:unnamed protein product [Arabis nemorensis]
MDLESGTVQELNKLVPGMWQYPTDTQLCCIYRVPNCLRSLNPDAYTPQLVIIGPLHHFLKDQALKSHGDITDAKSMGYLNMEAHKKIYLKEFAERFKGENIIDEFRRKINKDEERIRASYSESTAWIQTSAFVEMVLLDSVFIFQLIWKFMERKQGKTGDRLMDEPCLEITVKRDLMLLENQLPYFILEKLFEPRFLPKKKPQEFHDFRKSIITYFFAFKNKIRNDPKFIHFTDLLRRVRVGTLPDDLTGKFNSIENMYNADKLHSGGVKFKAVNKEAVEEEVSFKAEFKKGCLKLPCLRVDDEFEITIRNIMALEQCHYPSSAHVCNYFIFLDYLIETDKDVNLLVEKGIIQNCIGENRLVAEMVNKLCLGILDRGSYCSDIANKVNDRYNNLICRSYAVLKNVYFGNLWTGTATVAATLLLLMTLIQTMASTFQVMQDAPY